MDDEQKIVDISVTVIISISAVLIRTPGAQYQEQVGDVCRAVVIHVTRAQAELTKLVVPPILPAIWTVQRHIAADFTQLQPESLGLAGGDATIPLDRRVLEYSSEEEIRVRVDQVHSTTDIRDAVIDSQVLRIQRRRQHRNSTTGRGNSAMHDAGGNLQLRRVCVQDATGIDCRSSMELAVCNLQNSVMDGQTASAIDTSSDCLHSRQQQRALINVHSGASVQAILSQHA